MAGILPPLLGASSTAMLGMLIEGTEPPWMSSVSSTQIDGIGVPVEALGIVVLSSATTILGIAMGFFGWAMEEEDLLGVAGSDRSGVLSVDSSGACQLAAKLTIGRPGLSLTAVGSGRLGLRSFKRILVAARISSLRTSMPFFLSTLSSTGTGLSLERFLVYSGLRERVGGLRYISTRSSGFVLSASSLGGSKRTRFADV
jgi:hypothetical protein